MFTEQSFFDALSDATRRQLLLLLLSGSERCVCELFEALDLPQPKVSRHLAVLRDAGLVVTSKQGTWVYYRLHPDIPFWATRIIDFMASGPGASSSNRNANRDCCK